MDIDKFLSYDHKIARISIVVAALIMLVGFVMGSTDDIYYVFIFVGGVWGLVFLIIDIINSIKTKKVLNEYGIENLRKEIKQDNSILFEKRTYITENYVICHTNRPLVTPIDEIYKVEYSTYKGFNFLVATLKDQRKVSLAKVNDMVSANKLKGFLKQRNPNIE